MPKFQPNRRDEKIRKFREELKKLRSASEEEKQGLKDLHYEQRNDISSLRRADDIRKNTRNEQENTHNTLESVHADPLKNEPLIEGRRMLPLDLLELQFDSNRQTLMRLKK